MVNKNLIDLRDKLPKAYLMVATCVVNRKMFFDSFQMSKVPQMKFFVLIKKSFHADIQLIWTAMLKMG